MNVEVYGRKSGTQERVAYSSTLTEPRTRNTRLERHLDAGAAGDLKAAATRALLVGGPNLAAHALAAAGRRN